jgi:release factor glutamine methyltransferase
MRISDALREATAAGVERLDAQLLLSYLLHQPRSWLLAHDDHTLGEALTADWQARLARRAAGEPLAYVLGEWHFRGLRLTVSPAVLVPRPETELLVEWSLECLDAAPSLDVLDLGTGSGAVALAIAAARPQARVHATDTDSAALAVAHTNATRLGLPVQLSQGDWWGAVTGRKFGLVVSNPPYIAPGDPHLQALGHEPMLALTAAGQGLDALGAIAAGAPGHLLPGAWLLLEHGHDQAAAVQGMLQNQGFVQPQTRADLAGLARCTGARWPGNAPAAQAASPPRGPR